MWPSVENVCPPLIYILQTVIVFGPQRNVNLCLTASDKNTVTYSIYLFADKHTNTLCC